MRRTASRRRRLSFDREGAYLARLSSSRPLQFLGRGLEVKEEGFLWGPSMLFLRDCGGVSVVLQVISFEMPSSDEWLTRGNHKSKCLIVALPRNNRCQPNGIDCVMLLGRLLDLAYFIANKGSKCLNWNILTNLEWIIVNLVDQDRNFSQLLAMLFTTLAKCISSNICLYFWGPFWKAREGDRKVSDTNLPFICRVSCRPVRVRRVVRAFRQKVGVAVAEEKRVVKLWKWSLTEDVTISAKACATWRLYFKIWWSTMHSTSWTTMLYSCC